MSPTRPARLRVVVSGMVAADPYQGGATWAVLQYVLGLRELGHEVLLVEPIQPQALRPRSCALADSVNARYFRQVVDDFGLERHAALLLSGSRETVGVGYEELREECGGADMLLDISGLLVGHDVVDDVPIRAYLDLDPAFNQLWHACHGIDMRFDGHTHFATVGLGLGSPECSIPTCGREWITTLQPVVLSRWTVADEPAEAYTTIANWRGYGSIEHDGTHYGQKAHSLRRLITLPSRCSEPILLALAIHADERRDIDALSEQGWSLTDPAAVAADPAAYRAFIRGSKGELGVAKSGYVASRCGWFSDRSACYLASGRPVLAQDTGFGRHLPTGKGLIAFADTDGAVAGLEAVCADYPGHRRAARALAEEHFDSELVLESLLRRIGAS